MIAIPRAVGTLQDAVTQLASLRWVADNTPELEGDPVAKNELSVQQIQAEREAFNKLAEIFGGTGQKTCTWHHKGQPVKIDSQRTRNTYISNICDEVYDKTPIIRNELINRRKISGAVTTARKRLIQAMLEKGDEKNLGITSYPAEMSIYRSLLWKTGIHREVEGACGFYPPKPDDNSKMGHTWNAIEAFLESCEGERQPIIQLYEHLMVPPLGLRREPLPILLCAAMCCYKTEVALYENGSFIPEWSMPVFERFLKAPQNFELKRFRIAGIRANLFAKFSRVLNQSVVDEIPDLLTVVTPLIQSIAQLPKYTLLTKELSDHAKNLREAVLNAREPDELLFNQLPEALGFPVFGADTARDTTVVSDFFITLQKALSELEQAYEVLLNSIEQLLMEAFNLTSTKEELRAELAKRAKPLLEIVIETELKGFLRCVCEDRSDFTNWLVGLANYLAKKPPASWVDVDKAQFESNLSQVARKFQRFEAVSFENLPDTESSGGEPIRIGITRPKKHEQEQVVILPSTAEEQAEKLEQAIEQILDKIDTDRNPEFRLAVLARISQKLMQEEK